MLRLRDEFRSLSKRRRLVFRSNILLSDCNSGIFFMQVRDANLVRRALFYHHLNFERARHFEH
jgi:hypothetical protein